MTTTPEPGRSDASRVDLSKSGRPDPADPASTTGQTGSAPTDDAPFDPYRFGKPDVLPPPEYAPIPDAAFDPYRFGAPDVPPPPEYAPPGYVPPAGYVAPPAPGSGRPPAPPAMQPSPYGPPQGHGDAPTPYSSYPYGQPPPGAPAPPAYHGYAQPRTGNGKATTALVLGIVSIVLFWTTVFDAIPVILAVVFGLLGLNEARSGRSGGRRLAIAGLACATVGAILAITATILFTRAINECGGVSQKDSPGFQQCVQEHL